MGWTPVLRSTPRLNPRTGRLANPEMTLKIDFLLYDDETEPCEPALTTAALRRRVYLFRACCGLLIAAAVYISHSDFWDLTWAATFSLLSLYGSRFMLNR